ncbi:Membrane protein insertase YidC [uncultured archaeon]|nr:Membrane protein insertase YidC [uncultured archaeon]
MIQEFFDKTLGFMLNWNPIWAILVLSLIISILIVVIYKFTTNQEEMKQMKDGLKKYQQQMKETKDMEQLGKIQKETMSLNMKYMGKSMKPTLITFIPILLIFGWMNAHFAYQPLMPGEEFEMVVTMAKNVEGNVTINVPEGLEVVGEKTSLITDKTAKFKLKGAEGEYFATLSSNEQEIDKKIIITTAPRYATTPESYKSNVFKTVALGNKPLKVYWKLSWIWVYILSAIVFSTILRKAMKVY